jgi:hypothetical protein
MQFLWSYLNTIQILSAMPLLQLQMPPAMTIFFSNINKFNLMIFNLDDRVNQALDMRPISVQSRNQFYDIVNINS